MVVRCAVDVQRGMIERNTNVPQGKHVEFRIGINVGDIIISEGPDARFTIPVASNPPAREPSWLHQVGGQSGCTASVG